MARTISSAAPAPCTAQGASSTPTLGSRRLETRMMSRMTAPEREVATPITLGSSGSSRLRAGSNRPSAASFFFNASKRR